jgi:hypothetical protein
MKNLKQVAITTLLILASSISFAQKTLKDSISVKIEDKIEARVSIYDYSDLNSTLLKDLESLQEILSITEDIPEHTPYSIVYKPNQKLTIKTLQKTETIIWEKGKHMPYEFENRCTILSDKYLMTFYFSDLAELSSEGFTSKLKEAINLTIADNSRYSKLFNYTFDKNSLVNSSNYNIAETSDMLFLKAGVGTNLIKNRLVIDLAGEIGIGLNKKGITKNQYYVSYNLLYDFIENSSANLNGFLNIGYQHNFTNSKDKNNWLGLEFGYLVNQNGNLFDDDTFRVGFNWELGSSISVSPQLYISKENTFPGLRIGFGF